MTDLKCDCCAVETKYCFKICANCLRERIEYERTNKEAKT